MSFVSSAWRCSTAVLSATVLILCLLTDITIADRIRSGADPSIMKYGDDYYSADSDGSSIWVHRATSLQGLDTSSEGHKVWSNPNGLKEVWAPEITTDGVTTYIYFTAGKGKDHRMYVIASGVPLGLYSAETKLELPDDQWAIDGALFKFEGQRWFVWSGKVKSSDSEQALYICRMKDPLTPTGERYIISQPREKWEQDDKNNLINEGPEPIVDPNGQLHIVYSTNRSWKDKYCLADLRLRKGGDPTYVWDWYKSNGCLFGSHQELMMSGWDATLTVMGPGHHTFALPFGDTNESPGGVNHIPFVFHAVSKDIKPEDYGWGRRAWYAGSYVWWSETTYHRKSVPGDNENKGFSFRFFE